MIKIKFYSVLLAFFLFLISWLIPNHYYPWSTFYNDWVAGAGVLFLILGFVFVEDKRGQRIDRVVAICLFFSLIPIVQWLGGIVFFMGDALLAFLYIFGFCLAVFVGSNSEKNADFADVFASTLGVGALISVFLALCQWLGLDGLGMWLIDMPPGGRPYANLAQPNNLASLFGLGLVSVCYLRERGFLGRAVFWLVTILLFAGVAMTRSRMSIIVILVLAGWLFLGIRRLQLRCSRVEVLAGIGIFLGLWLAWPTISESLYLSADSSLARLEGAVAGELRWVIWRQLLDAVLREPWFGYGWNQVSVAQMVVAAEYPASVFTEHAHNLLIDILCWNGLLFGGGVLLWLGWWVFSRMRSVNSLSAWFGMALVLVLGTHSMFEFPLDYAFFLVPFGFAVGFVEGDHGGRSLQLPRWVAGVVGMLGLVFAIWIFVEYQLIQTDYNRLRYESAGLEIRSANPAPPDVKLLTQSREFIRFARTEARQGMSAEELEWMRQVAFRYAYPPAMFRYALALGLNGRYEEAETQLLRLRQLHPPIRYQEAQEGWAAMAERFPELGNVRVPGMAVR